MVCHPRPSRAGSRQLNLTGSDAVENVPSGRVLRCGSSWCLAWPSRLFGLGRAPGRTEVLAQRLQRKQRQRCRSRQVLGGASGADIQELVEQLRADSGQLVDAHEEDGLELQPLDVLNIEDPDVALLPDSLAFAAGDHLNVLVGERLVQALATGSTSASELTKIAVDGSRPSRNRSIH